MGDQRAYGPTDNDDEDDYSTSSLLVIESEDEDVNLLYSHENENETEDNYLEDSDNSENSIVSDIYLDGDDNPEPIPEEWVPGEIHVRKLVPTQIAQYDQYGNIVPGVIEPSEIESEGTIQVPLSKAEIFGIVTNMGLSGTSFHDMMMRTEIPIFSSDDIEVIYESYMETVRTPSDLIRIAKELGGDDRRWLEVTDMFKNTIDTRSDLQNLYEGYLTDLQCGESGCSLPREENPFEASPAADQYKYLMKKKI